VAQDFDYFVDDYVGKLLAYDSDIDRDRDNVLLSVDASDL
jgi:hypothetical protein